MKAIVKTTGEFIEVVPSIYDKDSYDGNDGYTYTEESLIMLNDEPDYWERLKHQYAGMFTKSFLDNCDTSVDPEQIIDDAINMATSLVIKLKLKEEEK